MIRGSALPRLRSTESRIFSACAIICLALTFILPPVPFIHDGGIYYHMALAMADHGALHIAANGGVEGAPPLTKHLTHAYNGLVYPQYPSGYAFIAAPFYQALGLRGLMLINALSAIASLWLTYAIGKRLFDQRIAYWGAGLLAAATFLPTYVWGVWPHLLALAFWLSAFYLALAGEAASNRRRSIALFAAAGFVVGAGINIRIDIILAAIALYFWLRFFARPEDRIAPAALAAGLLPGLLLAAWLNAVKFGDFTPFTYGPKSGADNIERYLTLIAGGAGLIVLTWSVNFSAIVKQQTELFKKHITMPIAFGLVAMGALAALLTPPIRDFLYGVYVLTINLQGHNAYYQEGVEINAFGQLVFWEYPKKALLQSLPYLPLLLTPVFFFLRGRHIAGFSLCFLAIGAPVSFYALNQWHGGGSYPMRYFTPALPFIALLSAWSISRLTDSGARITRQQALVALFAASVLYLGLQELGRASEALFVPAALYPQWLIAAALSGALAFHLWRPLSEPAARSALFIAAFAIAYAAAINANEAISHEKTRAEQQAMAREASASFSGEPLIVTPLPLMLIPAEQRGASVMAAKEDNMPAVADAAKAFAAAGRCVYFHNSLARDLAAPHLEAAIEERPIWAHSKRFANDPRMAFFTLTAQREACDFVKTRHP